MGPHRDRVGGATKNFLAKFLALCGLAAVGLVLTGLVAAGPGQSQSARSQGNWSTKAPLLTQHLDAGVVALDGKMYLLGGEAIGNPATPSNQQYDPATDRWRDLASMPRGISHAGVAAFNGKIYVIGGFTAIVHAVALNQVLEYDIATDSWRQLSPLSSPRGSIGVAVVGGKVHAIGGRGLNNVTVATHEVYDPVSGEWSQAAPLLTARDHIGVIVVDGRIHVLGGRISNHATDNSKPTIGSAAFSDLNNGFNTPLHDVYDPATNSWQSAPPVPNARSNGAAVYYHGLILYVGGECKKPNPNGGGDTFTENEAYDPKTNRWLTLAPMPAGRQGFGAATVGQSAYFAGGSLGCGGGPMTQQLLVFSLP
jgi:N-acetylneuraminic acid mutarotase